MTVPAEAGKQDNHRSFEAQLRWQVRLDRDVQNSTAAERSWALEISKDRQRSVQGTGRGAAGLDRSGEDAAGIHRDNDGSNRLQETGIAKTQVHQFGWTAQQDANQGLAASGPTDMQVRRIILDHQNRRGHEIG